MSQKNKPRMTVDVYEQFPQRRNAAAPRQFTFDQVRKWLSAKPLRRPASRNSKTESDG